MEYNSSIIQLKGIGEKTKTYFEKLGIHTVGELITNYPRDYEQYAAPVSVAGCVPGEICAVNAQVADIVSEKKSGRLQILSFRITDGKVSMRMTFFNMPFLKKKLKPGSCYIFRGRVQRYGSELFMEQPKLYTAAEYDHYLNKLMPIYSLTKGLTNLTFQKTVLQALGKYQFPAEYYPDEIIEENELLPEREAIEALHFPKDFEQLKLARKRVVFDEFFAFLYQLRQNSLQNEGLPNQYQMFETADTVRFLEKLPFPLTKAQKKVWQEIRDDLSSQSCMNRLIQGDVGSGKTILALLALLMTASNGYQGALMAPTEVLAMQHYETVTQYVNRYGICFKPVLLVGSMNSKEKKAAYEKIASGEANLIIGTHALIQDKVSYRSLALVVTDEQHRFGVRQRESLAEKGEMPHILVMSATPIPRTLAIILYGDLKISVVDELPADRKPIKNCVVNTSYRSKAYRFIAGQVAEGRQVYVICPQVEEGELENLENVVDYTEKLRHELPSSVQIAYLHGKMRPAEKNRIMDAFANHSIDVLVSTTVIEVGINVPNATVMMVENAERFGLAQLHQLRGRVGRGAHQSYCIFVSSQDKEETLERLSILNRSNDGFYIASQDLKLRGPGDLFGIRQSGEFSFRVGDIYSDAAILKQASDAVDRVLADDPALEKETHKLLKDHLSFALSNNIDFRTI